jgi:hypothetical protein
MKTGSPSGPTNKLVTKMNSTETKPKPGSEVWLYIKTHFTTAGTALLFLLMAAAVATQVAGFFNADVAKSISIPAMLLWAAIAALLSIVGFAIELHTIKRGKEIGDVERWGEILTYYAYPRPGTSLLEALKDAAEISPSQIQWIKLQTCAFDNPYLRKLADYFGRSRMGKTTEVEIMGVGTQEQERDLLKHFPSAHILRSQEKLHSHFNLVKARGRCFLWYEPQHDDGGSIKYTPALGAFLVEVSDEEAAIKQYRKNEISSARIPGFA